MMTEIPFAWRIPADSIREVFQVSLSVFKLESGSTAENSLGFGESMLVDDSVDGVSFVTSDEGVRKSIAKPGPKESIETSGGNSIVTTSVKHESMDNDCWPEGSMRLMLMISLHACEMKGISRLPR